MSYQVGVDLGSTFSAVAVCRTGGNPAPEIVPLGTRAPFLPSVLFTNSDGSVVIGEEADNWALSDPQRVIRQFTRRIGDGVPVLAGGGAVPAEVLAARFVARLLDMVANRLGGAASRIALTHPAGWGTHRVAALRDALVGEGIDGVRLLPEPQAAVLAHANRAAIEPGAAVAVYDLGGATFTAAVIRRLGADQFAMAGGQEDVELGGLDLDEVVFAHVVSALDAQWNSLDPNSPSVREAVSRLRRRCTAAKEALSIETEVHIPVGLPGIETQVRLTRAEFEEAIQPGVEETVGALERALSGVAPNELADVLLVGGSARIPLITQTVSERLGRAVTIASDPKGIVAAGAAIAARGPAAGPTRMLAPAALATVPEPRAYQPVGAAVPAPIGPPPRAQDSRRWMGLPRTVVTAVAATVLTAAIATTVTLMARHSPPSSDADPLVPTTTTTVTEETETPQRRNTREPAPPPATPPKTKKPEPPRTTTTQPTKPTTTTTTKPSPSSSSTTTSPTGPSPQTNPSQAGVR